MAYTNFTNCTEQEYLDIIYSQDETNRIRIWFNDIELENADEYCESLKGTNRILPNNGKKIFTLDNFISKEYELVLRDLPAGTTIEDQVRISIGTLVGENTYEDVPIGIFNIQDTPITDQNKVTIKLRDNRVKFDFNYNAQPLIDSQGGTATKREILEDICEQAGVTNAIESFSGEDDEIGIYDNTITATTYVSYLLEQAGLIPTIDREGQLIAIDVSNLKTWHIPLEIVEKYEKGEPYQIKRVVYESGIIKYETSNDESLDTLYLNAANPYITTQEQVMNAYDIVKDFKIDSATTGKVLGNPAIDSYDMIEIYDNRILPIEYTQVDYIKNSGTQYINTGFVPDFDNGFRLEIEYTPTYLNTRGCLLSNWSGANNVSFEIYPTGIQRLYIVEGNTNDYIEALTLERNKGVAQYYDGVVTHSLNGETKSFNRSYTGKSAYELSMFVDLARRFSTFTNYLKIYGCKMYDGTTLVRDFIPCYRNSDNEIGMYDLVNNQFYTNAGTGTFQYGAAINTTVLETLANNTYTYNGVHRQEFDTQIGLEERTENVSLKGEATFKKWAKAEIDNVNNQIITTVGEVQTIQEEINGSITYDLTEDTEYLEDKEYYSYDDENDVYVLLQAGVDYEVGDTISGQIYELSTTDSLSSRLDDIRESIETINTTMLTQTAEQFEMLFTQTGIKNDLDNLSTLLDDNNSTLNEISQYIRFAGANIELGRSDSNTKLVITNDRISFMTGDNESAYISDNQLYITDSTILNKLRVGHWETKEDENFNLNTRWVND